VSSVPYLNTPIIDFAGDTFPLDFIALVPYAIFEPGLLAGGLF
jgi:hypothetical protein